MSSLQHSRGRWIRQKAYKGSYDTAVEELGRMLLLLVLLEMHSIYRHVCGRNRHPRLLHLLSASASSTASSSSMHTSSGHGQV